MVRAALFDMDRTLVRKETASLYVRFQRDIGEASLRDSLRVLLWALEYTFGMIDVREVAARALLAFEGLPEEVLARRCQEMFERYVRMHISESAKRVVRAHRAALATFLRELPQGFTAAADRLGVALGDLPSAR